MYLECVISMSFSWTDLHLKNDNSETEENIRLSVWKKQEGTFLVLNNWEKERKKPQTPALIL